MATPASSTLNALNQRLNAAIVAGSGSFSLGPPVIQASAVSDLFGSLLHAANDTLAVRGATLSATLTDVVLVCSIDYPFGANLSSTLVFTVDQAQKLVLVLTTAAFGPLSVTDLIKARVAPGSLYDPATWAKGLPALPGLAVVLSSAARTLTVTGTPSATAWSVPAGPLSIAFGPAAADFTVTAPDGIFPAAYAPSVKTALQVGTGTTTTIPVRLDVPSGGKGWRIALDAPGGLDLGDLANFDPLMGGANSGLPSSIIGMGYFQLTSLAVAFPAVPTPDRFELSASFTVGGKVNPAWSVVGGLVVLESVTADIDLLIFATSSGLDIVGSGSIGGRLKVGSSLTLEATLAVPYGDEPYTLTARAGVASPSIADLASYLAGNTSPVTQALAQLGKVGALSIDCLVLSFVPSGPGAGLKALSFSASLSDWTIPALPWFRVESLTLSLEVDDPTGAQPAVSGGIGALLHLGGVVLSTEFTFTRGAGWHLQIGESLDPLKDLDALTDIVPKADAAAYLPSQITTSGVGLVLNRLTLDYDSQGDYVAAFSLAVTVATDWTWLGGLLTLENIDLALDGQRAGATAPLVLSGHIAGTIELAGAELTLTAERDPTSLDWMFYGQLKDSLVVDLSAVVSALGGSLPMPQGLNLPTVLSLDVLELFYLPATGELDFYGSGKLTWSQPFGANRITLDELGGEYHIAPTTHAASGAIDGRFTLGPVTGEARLDIGVGQVDNILTIDIDATQLVDAGKLVDAVAGSGTYGKVTSPAGFKPPAQGLKTALVVNLTTNAAVLTADYASSGPTPLYGSLVLIVAQDAKTPATWGFALAAELANWTLADISPVLVGVDKVLGLKSATAAVALALNGETAGAQLSAQVPAIPQGTAIASGLNLFAELDFTTPVLANVVELVKPSGRYTLAASIPSDTTKPIRLSASLDQLKLLGVLTFSGVVLGYTKYPSAGPTPQAYDLTLNGDITVTLGQDYHFIGDLTVSDKAAHFRIATGSQIVDPLGIPNVTLLKLGFEFTADFTAKPTKTTMQLFGEVAFGSTLTLAAFVGIEQGAAEVVAITLTAPGGQPERLSISDLFHQATGGTWPQVLDISLHDGAISYVPGKSPVIYQGDTYQPGFHATALTEILFLPAMTIDISMQGKGLTATAQVAAPIDWDFIKFTGTTGHGGTTAGPWASIDTAAALPFSLGAGIELMSTAIGEAEIAVGAKKMTGTITLPSSAGAFSGYAIDFSWDKDGFHVDNWDLQKLKLPKFELKDIKGQQGCGQTIVDSLPIDTKFDLKASLSIAPPGAGKPAALRITLNGGFDLVVTGSAYANDPLLHADVAAATVDVPFPTSGGYDWDMLAQSFIDAIVSVGESLIDNLFNDPKNAAKLAAVLGIKWAIGEAIDYLVCRTSKTPNPLQPAEAAALVDAALSAAATVVTVCGATVAVGGVVGTISGGVFSNQGHPANPTAPKPAAPGVPALSFDGDALHMSWAATDAAHTQLYAIELIGDDRIPVPVSAVAATKAQVPGGSLSFGQAYTARIIGFGAGGQGPPSAPASLFLVAAPLAPHVAVRGDLSLEVSWNGVKGAAYYEAQVLDAAGQPVTPAPDVRISGTVARISGSVLRKGGTFGVRIRARSRDDIGPWSPSSPVDINFAIALANYRTVPIDYLLREIKTGATIAQGTLAPNEVAEFAVMASQAKGAEGAYATLALGPAANPETLVLPAQATIVLRTTVVTPGRG